MSDANFDQWMAALDAEWSARYGLSIHDMEDMPFRAWFVDGMDAQEAADEMAEEAEIEF